MSKGSVLSLLKKYNLIYLFGLSNEKKLETISRNINDHFSKLSKISSINDRCLQEPQVFSVVSEAIHTQLDMSHFSKFQVLFFGNASNIQISLLLLIEEEQKLLESEF